MKSEAHAYDMKKSQKPVRLPDFSANDVFDIDFEALQQMGIQHIIFDLDATIRAVHSSDMEEDIASFLDKLNASGQFESISLATNNIRDVTAFSAPFGARIFQPYFQKGRPVYKPQRKFFQRILDTLHAEPHEVAMIGDKVNSDIAGANKAGLLTVLVQPRGDDYWYEQLLLTRYRQKRSIKRARERIEGNTLRKRWGKMLKKARP